MVESARAPRAAVVSASAALKRIGKTAKKSAPSSTTASRSAGATSEIPRPVQAAARQRAPIP